MPSTRFYRARAILVGVTVVLAFVLLIVTFSLHQARPLEAISLPRSVIRVEVASTASERVEGLSNQNMIADGVLLDWNAPGRHPIWMAEMRFPLDLVWIDGEGHVLAILPSVPPCVAQPCPLYEPPRSEQSHSVLELAAGDAAKYGLTFGAVVRREDGASRNLR